MIYIYKNNTNECAFTLMEKTTLLNANYILEFYSKANNDSKLLWLNTSADTSNNTARYNLFDIVEAPTDNVNNLQINLGESEYIYRVYETTGSTLALSAVTSNDIVEYGRCNVIWPNAHYNVDTYDDEADYFTYDN